MLSALCSLLMFILETSGWQLILMIFLEAEDWQPRKSKEQLTWQVELKGCF